MASFFLPGIKQLLASVFSPTVFLATDLFINVIMDDSCDFP